jgi:hypothetical protein
MTARDKNIRYAIITVLIMVVFLIGATIIEYIKL